MSEVKTILNHKFIINSDNPKAVVVFLHGWGGQISSFEFVANSLSDYNCLLLDFYGFGNSPIDRVLTLDDYVFALKQLIDFYQLKNFIIVGHSFGVRVGSRFCARFPDIVKAFVITDGAGLKPKRKLSYYRKVLLYKIAKKFKLNTSSFGSADFKNCSGFLQKTFVNIVNTFTDDDCKIISCPTLIVWGKDDKDTPLYMAKRFKKLIKNSEIVLLDGDHFCYVQNHVRYKRILNCFFNEVSNDLSSCLDKHH